MTDYIWDVFHKINAGGQSRGSPGPVRRDLRGTEARPLALRIADQVVRHGNLFVTKTVDRYVDEPNWIRSIDTSAVVAVFAGSIEPDYAGDSGRVSDALFDQPNGVAFESEGNWYVADGRSVRVRKIDRTETFTTVARYPVRHECKVNGQAS